MTGTQRFAVWRGSVGDVLICWSRLSIHLNNKGRIVRIWLSHYEPADQVVFRRVAGAE